MSPKLIFLILGLLSIILIFRMLLYFSNIKSYEEGQVITFETRVLDQPQISGQGQKVGLILPNSQRVTVILKLDPVLSYGDRIKAEGEIEYFMASDTHKIAFMRYPKFKLLEKGSKSFFIYKVRDNIISFFNSTLGPVHSSLILGIVFGIKQEMPDKFYENLKNTGLMHVIAASGMNITMVGSFLLGVFSAFLRRKLALILTIFGILVYALLAGLEPSIVRAAIMGILVFFAQFIGRQATAFLGLFIAGFVMLFLNPSLLFDIGFQLSFMATLGLVYLRPLFFLSSKLKKLIKKSIIGEDIATTLTAQIMTMPIIIVNFGTYAFTSVIANALVLWTVPIIMIFGGISALISFVFDPLSKLITYFSLPFLLYFEKIVNVFGKQGGQIEIKTLPLILICGYYLILSSIIMLIKRRN